MLKEKFILDLNEQIALFNQQVHAFEDQQQMAITNLWEEINKNYIATHQLSDLKIEQLKNAFAQALVNLSAMMQAKNLYEADLYRQSYIKALEPVKTPRRRFILLQSQSLELAHDAVDVQTQFIAVENELLSIKTLYGSEENAIFDLALTELKEMSQIKDKTLFVQKKKQYLEHLADIHEKLHQRTDVEKQCEADVEDAINRGQAIFDARSSYLEDKNHWMVRATDIAEKGWTGIGVGLSALSIALAVPALIGGVVLAPVGVFVAGIVGAAYGAFDLARTLSSTISAEIIPKLGEREILKPRLTWKDKAKQLAKKAIPIALCLLGAAIAIAAVVATGGAAAIGLAIVGAALSATGVGQMAYAKYQEKKEVRNLQQQYKAMNEPFDIKAEALIKQIPTETPKKEYTDSSQESMTLLAGHTLTATDLKSLTEDTESAGDTEEDEGESGGAQTEAIKTEKAEVEDSEAEGDAGTEQQLPEDDIEPPTPRP